MFNKNRVPRQARGSTAANDKYLGDAGQLTVDLGKFTIRVHDGSTVGGHPLAKEAIAISAVSPLEITQGGTLAENTEIGLRLSGTEGNVMSVAEDGGLYVAGSTVVSSVMPTKRNIGEIFFSLMPIEGDETIHLLDGSLLTLSMDAKYTELFSLVNKWYTSGSYPSLFVTEQVWQDSISLYGACGAFVYDEAGGTLRLPKVTNTFLEGTLDTGSLGYLVPAGLPNITGSITPNGDGSTGGAALSNMKSSGSLHYSSIPNSASAVSDNNSGNGFSLLFDASNSSTIYGESSTVQPQSIRGYYYMVVSQPAVSELDISNKADIDLSNLNAAGQKVLREAGFPSSSYINMSWTGTPISGSAAAIMEFIAPFTGYCVFSQLNSSGSSQALIDLTFWSNPNKSGALLSSRTFVAASYGCTAWTPIVEGGLVSIATTLKGNISTFMCISAIGSV